MAEGSGKHLRPGSKGRGAPKARLAKHANPAAPVGPPLSSNALALAVMMVVFGAGIVLYPTVADLYNRLSASRTISGYDRAVEQQEQRQREQAWQEAVDYNEDLAAKTLAEGGTIDSSNATAEGDARYWSALAVTDEAVMGYLSISKINVQLPVYHGMSEKVLQMGVGHLEGSSLPVGGTSTHCVLTGHTGLPSARLFTDLDKLSEGDRFQLTVLGQTLTYEVCEVRVVLPAQVSSLRLEEGEDLCTLVTCTPYGVNDHRLLVTGRRVSESEVQSTDAGTARSLSGEWPNLVVTVAVVVAAIGFIRWRIRRRNSA